MHLLGFMSGLQSCGPGVGHLLPPRLQLAAGCDTRGSPRLIAVRAGSEQKRKRSNGPASSDLALPYSGEPCPPNDHAFSGGAQGPSAATHKANGDDRGETATREHPRPEHCRRLLSVQAVVDDLLRDGRVRHTEEPRDLRAVACA